MKIIALTIGFAASTLMNAAAIADDAPSTFRGCPPTGTKGSHTADLNRLKNRWSQPPSFDSMTVDDIVALPGNEDTSLEAKGVVVEGYIVAAKTSEAETANCGKLAGLDKHVWLASSPQSPKAKSVVIEPTPYWQAQIPSLANDKTYAQLASGQTKVRVYGWLMYDPEHPPELGKLRATLWEIHPVTKIEVLADGQWQALQ